jgi:capsular exopolysaccharide synthesis family protein
LPQPSGPDSSGVARVLYRRWLLVLSVGLLVAGAAAAGAWFLIPPRFTAFALVHIASNQPWKVFPTPESRNDFSTYVRTQAAQIKSRYVLQAALNSEEVRKLNLYEREADPLVWLEDEIKVECKEGSEIVMISMTGPTPQELLALVNAVEKAYLHEVESGEKKRRAERVRELDGLYLTSREKLRSSRETWLRVANQLGSSDSKALTQKQLLLIGTYNKLKDQYLQVSYELKKAQARLTALEARPKGDDQPLPDGVLNQAVQQDTAAKQYLTRITQLEQVLADYDRNAVRGRAETGARLVLKDLGSTKASLEARREELREELTRQYRKQTQAQTETEVAELRHQIAPLEAQERWLGEEVERLEKETTKVGNTHTELDMLREDIKRDEQLTDRIANQLDQARLELNSPLRVTGQQEAALQKQDRKRQLVALVAAPLAAFACVGMCVVWWDTRSRRIQSVHEVVSHLGMRVMGAVPVLPGRARQPLLEAVVRPDVYGPNYLESIDAVRTLLLRDASADGIKVIMVTSAVEGEGKTTLAGHLASSLARAGRRTLLVDCDLRRPVLQDRFGLALEPGFSDVLRGQVAPAAAVQQTAQDHLSVLTAGRWDLAVHQILAREGPRPVLDPLRTDFDFIVIDSHPVLAATDSLLIGQEADAVILSLLRDRSQAPVVNAACQRLANLGIRMLGAVVNGVQRHEMYDAGYSYAVRPVR